MSQCGSYSACLGMVMPLKSCLNMALNRGRRQMMSCLTMALIRASACSYSSHLRATSEAQMAKRCAQGKRCSKDQKRLVDVLVPQLVEAQKIKSSSSICSTLRVLAGSGCSASRHAFCRSFLPLVPENRRCPFCIISSAAFTF